MIRLKHIAAISLILWVSTPIWAQNSDSEEDDEKKQVMGGYVLSTSGMGIIGPTYSRYDNFGTQWKGGAGISLTGGLGMQLRWKFKWAVELDLAYEFATYRYSHINLVRDIKLTMGYSAPYAALKGTYYFKPKNKNDDRPYLKVGSGYMINDGTTKRNSEADYSYKMKEASSPTIFLYGEYGWVRDMGDNITFSYGITYRYAFNDVITNTMNANNEYYSAVGFSRGNHLGFVVKFFYPIKSWIPTAKSGRDKDDDVRIRI